MQTIIKINMSTSMKRLMETSFESVKRNIKAMSEQGHVADNQMVMDGCTKLCATQKTYRGPSL